jgi:hypothetical protein
MTRLEFINQANTIADQHTERLYLLEAMAGEMIDKYGACCERDQDPHKAAIWLWIATEARGARKAIEELSEMVKGVAE